MTIPSAEGNIAATAPSLRKGGGILYPLMWATISLGQSLLPASAAGYGGVSRDQSPSALAVGAAAAPFVIRARRSAIRLRATRRIDQLRLEQKETTGLNQGVRWVGDKPTEDGRPTLAQQGIDKNLAHQARATARSRRTGQPSRATMWANFLPTLTCIRCGGCRKRRKNRC